MNNTLIPEAVPQTCGFDFHLAICYASIKGRDMEALMLPLPITSRDCNVKKVMNQHHEILRLSALGMKGREVALMLSCTPQTVYNVTNSELGRSQLAKLHGLRDDSAVDVAARIQQISEKAVEVVAEVLEDEEAGVNLRVTAAFKILDRAGHGPVQKIRGTMNHALFGPEELAEIKQQAIESGLRSGAIVDITDATKEG